MCASHFRSAPSRPEACRQRWGILPKPLPSPCWQKNKTPQKTADILLSRNHGRGSWSQCLMTASLSSSPLHTHPHLAKPSASSAYHRRLCIAVPDPLPAQASHPHLRSLPCRNAESHPQTDITSCAYPSTLTNIFLQCHRIPVGGELSLFQINLNETGSTHAIVHQCLLIKRSEQEWLATSADAGDNLHLAIPTFTEQLIYVLFSFYQHIFIMQL